MQLQDIAIPIKKLVTVKPNEPLNALAAPTTETVGCFIVEEKGIVLGILTDGDLRRAISANKSDAVAVEDAMTRDPISMPERTDLPRAFSLMTHRNINHLLVRNDIGQETGIVSFHAIAQKLSPNNYLSIRKKTI